jgi:hypothetical protein
LLGDADRADELAAFGGAKVLRFVDPLLEQYTPEGWTAAVSRAIEAGDYALVLTGHS